MLFAIAFHITSTAMPTAIPSMQAVTISYEMSEIVIEFILRMYINRLHPEIQRMNNTDTT